MLECARCGRGVVNSVSDLEGSEYGGYLRDLGAKRRGSLQHVKAGPGFSFSAQDFNSLASLPLFRNGTRDLNDRAVVVVGYTLGTWQSRNMGDKNLLMNLQFVIVLGVAATPAH
jgi:hypothetical protein